VRVSEQHESHGIGSARNSARNGCTSRRKSAATKEIVDQEKLLLLLEGLALTAVGVTRCADLGDVANKYGSYCPDT